MTNATPAVPVTVTFEARGGVIEGYDYLDLTFVGGEYDAYTATILSGNAIEVLPIPVRSGLQFCGWFTGTTINDGQWLNNNTVSVDFTLYARWTSHPFVHYDRVEPDCTNDGNIEYWYCPDCDQYFSDPGCTVLIDEGDIILPAAGHMMTEYPYKAATCTEDGNVAYWYCNVCEKYFSDAEGANSIRENQIGIPATGHSYTETVVNPTCITGGYTLHECSLCGDSYRDNELPKLGHNFVDGVCSVCGEQFYSDGLEFTLSGDKSYYTVTDVGTATGDIIIPDTFNGLPVREIGEYAFYCCTDITSIAFSSNITYIGVYAFRDCSSLTSIEIPAGVTSIGSWVFSGCSSLTYIEIPAGVTSIGRSAFEDCSSLTSIEIPAGVTSIGGSAFEDCSNLNSVYYTGSIENWFNIEFENYYSNPSSNGADLYIGGELVTEVVVPESITTIGNQLTGCTSLTSITIHSGVTSIGSGAFDNCSSLASVTFAEGSQLTSIGSSAFRDCISLKSIEIPAGVTSIGDWAFYGCSSLESVTFAEGSQLTSIGEYVFWDCNSLTSISIPAGVTSIGEFVFRDCSSLESVTFAEGSRLTSIGIYAFYGCSNLESVTFGEGSQLTDIGSYAFEDCSSLKSIEIPAGVSELPDGSYGSGVFYGCSNLESVTFAEGSQLTSIGEYAFSGCSSLMAIEIPAGVSSIGSSAFSGCSSLTSVGFAEGSQLTDIGNAAFYGCSSLTSILIPAGVTTIGSEAFQDCSSLTSIEIPAGVTSIGGSAFEDCSNLTGVTFGVGSQLTSIGENAFYECFNLNTVYYAGSIEDWFNIEFESSTSNPLYYVADLYIEGESVTEVVVPESVTTIGDYQFSGYDSLTSITINSGVTSIGDYAFSGCSSLTSISIPAGVTSIGGSAFSGCSSLTSIEIPAGVTTIGNSAFYGCYLTIVYNYSDLEITAESSDYGGVAKYAEVVLTEENQDNVNTDENGYVTYTDGEEVLLLGYLGSETDIVIPEGVTRIAKYAFYGDDIVSVTLPESLTAIGEYAFYECYNIKSLTLPESLTAIEYSAFDGCYNLTEVFNNSSLNITAGSYGHGYVALYAVKVHNSSESESIFNEDGFAIVDGVLYGYRGSATNIIIPETVTSIAEDAFYGNTDIISVTIPAMVSELPDGSYESGVFFGCSNLESVTFAEGSQLTSIGEYAFYECSSLTSIEIPAGVTSIGSSAFRFCRNLNTVYYAGSIENWFDIAFEESDSNPLINGAGLYIGGELVTEVVVPESVTTIDDYQFYRYTSLTSITIHSGVTSIGEYAFYNCSNLESVTFAEGSQLTSIGDSAFSDCSSLTSTEIPAGVTSIGRYAFQNCSSLTDVSFAEGSQLTTIGWYAFNGCSSLSSISISAGVTSIGSSAFSDCSNLVSVTFAEGSQLTSIGDYAFDGCSRLTSIEIPAGVTSIGGSAFSGCSNLESVTFGEGSQLTSIGSSVFYECSSLMSIEIPAGVTELPNGYFNNGYYGVFSGCSSLESVSFAEGSLLTSIGSYAFNGCSSLTSIEIPAGVTSIGSRAFENCSSLTSIEIPAGVTSIGSEAFWCCSNLESVTFADGSQLTSIGSYAFIGCSSLTSIEIPAGVTSIGSCAFAECSNLTSIEIPAGVTSIGSSAFSDCSNLVSVTFAEGSQLTSIGSDAFDNTSAKNVYISDTEAWCNIEFENGSSNPLGIGGVLWLNGEMILDLNIPAEAGTVGAYSFYNAERIKNVVIEEGVTEIGNYAFYSMYRLESVTIPSTVTKIGSYAFAHSSSPDSKLKYIYYNGTEKDWLSVEKGSNWDRYCGDYEIIFRPELAEYEVAGEVIESDATENDADNAMIEGASIVLEGENGVFEAASGSGGEFGFEDVPEGEYTLTVIKEGYITVTKEVFVDSNMFYRIVIDLDAVNTLTGKVTVADDDNDFGNNAPLEGAAVTITRLSSTNAFTYTALTDADGEYSFQGLTIGRYMITVSKDGYRSVTQQFNVYMYQNNIRNIVLEAIPGTNITDGNAAGKIIDSVTGYGVGGLTLDIYEGVNITTGTIIATLTSGENGRYVTPDLTPGNYTIAIRDNRTLSDENERYNDGSIVIKILSDKLIDNQNGYVTNNRQLDVESIRIVLTWGVYPRDLDSHLDIDLSDGTHAHTYYSDKTYYRDGQLMADLDLDDTTSYGPETTTVYVMEEGVYTFYVHDYTNRTSSNSTSLANSGAKVEVYLGNSSVAAYVAYVPDDPGTLWTVFSYNSVTGMITPINDVTYHSSPSSIGQ